ncbi:MAG: hypothetical protein ACR2OF_06965 [Hyphomicrobium sp.]
MTDHADRLNAMMGDMFDAYDKSDGPIAKEQVLEALITSMVSILSSIEPRELRRERIKMYQKAFEVAESDEDDNGSGVLQ